MGKKGLIVFDDVGYGKTQDYLRRDGYTVFGGCEAGDRLEKDREFGQKLFASYGEGFGRHAILSVSENFPLVTWFSTAGVAETGLATRPDVCRRVVVDYSHDKGAVCSKIRTALSQGQCVAWIRNTVVDAIDAFEIFSELPQENKLLFHARFAMGDRLDLESKTLDYFGPDSSSSERRGKLVIATQVIEQSLDVDFDFMVSDLAPVDRVVQRAGRLCRHVRNKRGDRVQGTDERGEPRMMIFGPEWTNEPKSDWCEKIFRGGSFVYPHHGQLWLTAQLFQRGSFSMPEDARQLIECVYGEEAQEKIPQGLRSKCNKAEGNEDASRCIGRQNSLPFESGYSVGDFSDWWREAKTPTRLGDPSVEVRLMRWDGTQLRYWFDSDEDAADLSAVRVSAKYILPSSLPTASKQHAALEMFKSSLPDEGRWSGWLVLTQQGDGLWHGETTHEKSGNHRWIYDTQSGLRLRKQGQEEAYS